jgi:hypothetical protein
MSERYIFAGNVLAFARISPNGIGKDILNGCRKDIMSFLK